MQTGFQWASHLPAKRPAVHEAGVRISYVLVNDNDPRVRQHSVDGLNCRKCVFTRSLLIKFNNKHTFLHVLNKNILLNMLQHVRQNPEVV